MRRVVLIVCVVGFVASAEPVRAQAWPPKIENLQFFPAGTGAEELLKSMTGFSFALGVRCQHCHVGEEGQPLSSFDFASDEKESKRKARLMLRMVAAINGEHLPQLGGEAADRLSVECVTCHRGVTRPEQLQAVLLGVARAESVEAALDRYDELRADYFGSHSYNFAEETLVLAGEALLAERDAVAAVAFFERNLVHFPESSWTLGDLARAEEQRNNLEGAIRTLERALELSPGDPWLTKELERVKGKR